MNIINAMKTEQTNTALVEMLSGFGACAPNVKKQILETWLQNPYNYSAAFQYFTAAWNENPVSAVRLLFYFRDVRGGVGQKNSTIAMLRFIANTYPEVMKQIFRLIPEYGSWKDLVYLFDTKVGSEVVRFYFTQLLTDHHKMLNNEPISLAAKWFPSENSGKWAKEKYELALQLRGIATNRGNFRKVLAKMRKHIGIVEEKISENEWWDIDYSKVPSRAMNMYKKAFENHAPSLFAKFLSSVEKGETKINASTIGAPELTGQILRLNARNEKEIRAITAQWNALPKIELNSSTIVIADTSGSMSGEPQNVAVGLALYFAENLAEPFKNHFLTFSDRPKLQEIKGENLWEKMRNIDRANWDSSTNLDAAMKLILDAAIAHKLSQDDLPKVILIISDMCFNGNVLYTHKDIVRMFAQHGYTAPNVVFWNVRDAKVKIARPNDQGVILMSGYNKN